MEQSRKRLEDTKTQAFKKLAICLKVKETLDTPGWKEIIEPIIDKTIIDTIGGKIGGRWTGGSLTRAIREDKKEFYLGGRQYLIDTLNRIYGFIDNIDILEHSIKSIESALNAPIEAPMMEKRSRYAPGKR